jgi:hypothetical protein
LKSFNRAGGLGIDYSGVSELEAVVPDINEMLESMTRDGVFRHEMMLNYFKYKNKEEPAKSIF